MTEIRPVALAALTAGAALACAAAALLSRRIGADPWVGAGLVGAVALCPASAAGLLAHRLQRAGRARARRIRDLAERLDASGSETESRSLLLAHVQQMLPAAGVVMLNRAESVDRLEPAFGERVADTPLRGLLIGHPRPQACLALRLGRTHRRSATQSPAAGCALCGRLAGESVCEPLRARGRILGSLLVASVDPIDPLTQDELCETAARAAPLVALQGAAAAAEHHAGRDPLTGLLNRRAAEDAVRRLSARAGRSVSPLTAVLVDLDRLAEIDDRLGQERGDAVLAEVATALAGGVRASDLVARWARQAFLVLTPDTDRTGAVALAEKLRGEVEALVPAGADRVTASFGVASVPEDAADAEGVLRGAERALGLARALGGNRVATPEPSPASGA